MKFLTLILVFITAFVAWWFLRELIPLLHRFLLDHPNERSSHCNATPRGGGLVFVLLSCLASVLAWSFSPTSFSESSLMAAAPLFALPLAIVGLIDDRFNIPASYRFVFQLSSAFVIICLSPLSSNSFAFLPVFAFLLIAVAAIINFINFMDGIDGLVSGCMIVAVSTSALCLSAPWPIWSLVGSLIGFLIWNWSPAKVFMGDVGSTFLGFVFAFLLLQSPSWHYLLSLLLVATPLLGDAFFCLLRRLIHGHTVFDAHRLHLFQRLHQAGWPHSRVSILYIGATTLLALSVLFGSLYLVITLVLFVLLIGFALDQFVASPFPLSAD